ncbi:MAG: type II toxin-antitoxin system RelE/ParE family toxin [Streptococcaceae bacterium]|jgi:plasmid stabilization system protein ParE|nr:type II toxin-antitoxin system RelE/ParE family toxin [Streptococcaceae bacterium]
MTEIQHFEIASTQHFYDSMEKIIEEWEDLEFPEATIQRFVKIIYQGVNSLKTFPKRYADVSELYAFTEPTRRLLIGKSYAIFYRVNAEKSVVVIGSVFNQWQMKVKF